MAGDELNRGIEESSVSKMNLYLFPWFNFGWSTFVKRRGVIGDLDDQ